MQNIEKYFGFKVSVLDELDPIRVEVLRGQAEKIIAQHDFNDDEYFVYFHQVSLSKTKEKHFGLKGGVAARLNKLELTFAVNKKQQRNQGIKIFNYLLDGDPLNAIDWSGGTDSVTYHIEGDYLAQHLGSRNVLITFISVKIRESHRKLKISVVAHPTDEFSKHIFKATDQRLTQLDYKFKKRIRLRSPRTRQVQFNPTQSKGDTYVGDTFNFNGPTQNAAVGSQATANETTNQQVNLNSQDLQELRKQLAQLYETMKARACTPEQEAEAVIVSQAEAAAAQGNSEGVMNQLRKVGKWTLDVAREVGVGLTVETIKGFAL